MNKSKVRKILVLTGVFCSIVSFLALLMSLALPGIGWMVAAVNLIAASILVPFIGRQFVIIVFIVSCFHLFTLGPFSLFAGQGQGKIPTTFLIVYVIIPALTALISIFIPASVFKAKHKSD